MGIADKLRKAQEDYSEYQGGLSDKLFDNKIIQKYLEDQSPPFGYLGSSARKPRIDKAVENSFKRLKTPPDKIADFLIGKPGRWLGDAIEDMPQGRVTEVAIQKAISKLLGHKPNIVASPTFKKTLALLKSSVKNEEDLMSVLGAIKAFNRQAKIMPPKDLKDFVRLNF